METHKTPLILEALTDPELRTPEALLHYAAEESLEDTPWL